MPLLAAAGTAAQLAVLEAHRGAEAARVLVSANRRLLHRHPRSRASERIAVVAVVARDSIPLLGASEAFALVR